MNTHRLAGTASILAGLLMLQGCVWKDDNTEPKYGKESGLPVNCRAYVQVVVDSYRAGRYSADDSMAGLERNCGLYGLAWADNRDK